MKKSFIMCVIATSLAVSCQTDDPAPESPVLSEELSAFEQEVTEDLGLTKEQSTQLREALHEEESNAEVPGFLWLVARHLQENLPGEAKSLLLQQIIRVEQALTMHGVCIPLGFELNLSDPIHPHPAMIEPLLRDEQKQTFIAIIQAHQQVATQLVVLRQNNLIAPEIFHVKMQENFNSLMYRLVVGLLTEEQRIQLKTIITQLALARQQYIQQSYHVMAAALGLNEDQLQKTVSISIEIETRKALLEQKFHAGEIDQLTVFQAILQTCGEFHNALGELYDSKQLETVLIYRALSFRPRSH